MAEGGGSVRALRRLGYAALVLGFAQIVFGAIVRITGSGLGCGDHWPDCYGSFTPAHRGIALLIEISHRYGAALLSLAVLALFLTAWAARARGERSEGPRAGDGAFAPSAAALALVIAAAIFGAVTVKFSLATWVVVTHLAIAMALLAVLVEIVVRAGGFGSRPAEQPASRSFSAARAALGLAFLTLILGALTANTAGAPVACLGFPWCRVAMTSGAPLAIQITHRVLALVLFGHLLGLMIAARRRESGSAVARAATAAFSIVVLQILVAAALVELQMSTGLRSAHQTVGTLLWVSIAVLYSLAAPRGVTMAAGAAG
jgi:heme a synthase